MPRRSLGAALAAVLLVSAALAPGPASAGPPVAERIAHEAACRYYENRARFLPREGEVEFVVLLAEGCRAARRSLLRGTEVERRAAAFFLAGVVRLRDTVIDLNMRQAYGPEAGPRDMPLGSGGRMRSLGGVSATGEFLIAHRMGLLRALDDWRGQAPGFSLAIR